MVRIKKKLLYFLAALVLPFSLFAQQPHKPVKAPYLIYYGSTLGRKLLHESSVNSSFWPISRFYVAQQYLSYCGPASAVIVLNALGRKPVQDIYHFPYAIYNQDNIFSAAALAHIAPTSILHKGLTIAELAELIRANHARAKVVLAQSSSYKQFMKDALAALKSHNRYIVVNYYRKSLGQTGGGHISPLAAYDALSDRFLIMDVSRYKYPPAWVKSKDLWTAINTIDSDSHKTRGYLLVS